MGPVRVANDYTPEVSRVQVTLKADVTNLETSSITGLMKGLLYEGRSLLSDSAMRMKQSFKLGPLETKTITIGVVIDDAQIWWPKQWGKQPLYTTKASVMAQGYYRTIASQ